MRNILAIAQKEVKSYFSSPIAYAIVAVYLLIMGFTFTLMLFLNRTAELVLAHPRASCNPKPARLLVAVDRDRRAVGRPGVVVDAGREGVLRGQPVVDAEGRQLCCSGEPRDQPAVGAR